MAFNSTYKAGGEHRPGWDETVARKQVARNTSRGVVMRFGHARALDSSGQLADQPPRTVRSDDVARA